MADKPILFSAPMVRALLAGTKTQTRRAVKDVPPMPEARCHPQNTIKHPKPYLDAYCGERKTPENPRGMSERWCWWQIDDRECYPTFSLKYKPGDRLWVREHWRTESKAYDDLAPSDIDADYPVIYKADTDWSQNKTVGRFRQSMHMPRWASRITLTVTDVRVERLQDISEVDALAEGIDRLHYPERGDWGWPQRKYREVWEAINGPGSWDANPWVAAYTFTVQFGNIDAPEVPHG